MRGHCGRGRESTALRAVRRVGMKGGECEEEREATARSARASEGKKEERGMLY